MYPFGAPVSHGAIDLSLVASELQTRLGELEQCYQRRLAATPGLAGTVVIKLNGGLGTSMGMDRAKSLLCVRRGLSFLDIIARQVLHLRHKYDATLPLLFPRE